MCFIDYASPLAGGTPTVFFGEDAPLRTLLGAAARLDADCFSPRWPLFPAPALVYTVSIMVEAADIRKTVCSRLICQKVKNAQ